MQDPQVQLKALGLNFPDAIEASRAAVLDVEHRSFVNYETYFFADAEAKARFDADPTRYCGPLTDPVSKRRFRPGALSPRSDHDGRVYFFFTEAGKTSFDRTPSAFARPSYDHIMTM